MQSLSCSIKGIIRQLLAYKRAVILGNIVALLSTLLIVIIPLLIPILVDELLLGKEHGFIAWISQNLFTSDTKGYVFFILAIIVFLRILSTLLSIIQSKIFTVISKKQTCALYYSL